MPYIVLVVLVLALIALFLLVTYNGLVKTYNRVKNQRSQIDVELKRRFDLIPNLVDIVKGYAGYEKTTLIDVVEARNAYVSASSLDGQLSADDSLSGALSQLFALVESYPNLMANTNFLDLQKTLIEVEKQIAYSRQFYNDAINIHNNKVESFPSNIVAGILGFKRESYFEAQENERKSIKL